MKHHVVNLELDAAHVLLGHDTLLGGPLERGDAGILNLVEVLHTLAHVDDKVGAGGVGTEAPDLLGEVLVPAELLGEVATARLGLVAGVTSPLSIASAIIRPPCTSPGSRGGCACWGTWT